MLKFQFYSIIIRESSLENFQHAIKNHMFTLACTHSISLWCMFCTLEWWCNRQRVGAPQRDYSDACLVVCLLTTLGPSGLWRSICRFPILSLLDTSMEPQVGAQSSSIALKSQSGILPWSRIKLPTAFVVFYKHLHNHSTSIQRLNILTNFSPGWSDLTRDDKLSFCSNLNRTDRLTDWVRCSLEFTFSNDPTGSLCSLYPGSDADFWWQAGASSHSIQRGSKKGIQRDSKKGWRVYLPIRELERSLLQLPGLSWWPKWSTLSSQ